MTRLALLFLPLLAACNKGGDPNDSDTDAATDTNTELTFADFINVTDEATGDFSCHPGGEPWLTQTPDPALQTVVPTSIIVNDFQSDEPVPDATTTVWFADDVTGTPDAVGVTDVGGIVSLDLKRCVGLSYKTGTDPDLEQTKDTYEAHQMIPADLSGNQDFNSVSDTTYKIIPSLLGISPDLDKGIIAGTAFDCNEDPIENAQVIVVDDDGNIPQKLIVKYFVDSFPNRDQPDTSPDGLWVAINVPEGTWNVQMWTVRDGTLVLSGQTRVQSYADSINIGNAYSGFGDGVKYPDSCLLSE
jgi:hypothetical protein